MKSSQRELRLVDTFLGRETTYASAIIARGSIITPELTQFVKVVSGI